MKPVSIIALSFFFSAFGDRLWTFAVGLYLVKLTPGSLLLAAVYGLVLTATAILFSPVIGQYVDRNNRIRVVRSLLVTQNCFVMFCAISILIYLNEITSNTYILRTLQGLIILFGSIANLAGVGEKIAVSKDWVVVVCKQDSNVLSNANALLRRIDLTVAILAPVGVGFLMTVISDLAGIVFILFWNIVTMFAEYFLLYYVYRNDADLPNKGNTVEDETKDHNSESKSLFDGEASGKHCADDENDELLVTTRTFKSSSSISLNVLSRLKTVLSGWKVYRKQTVFLAGSALAWLYLTVLGFNEITTSYAYSQGLKEVYVSICFGLGSVFGITGTFLFPLIRKQFGLPKTGILGNMFQLSMLLLCVISIWLPGSPSSLVNDQNVNKTKSLQPSINCTLDASPVLSTTATTTINTKLNPCNNHDSLKENISIIVFMIGIILSRAGLWISDLTITQLQQENVAEDERGTVGGVQSSFNNVFNLLHYIVTILLPYPDEFWILILMSVFAVLMSFLIYVVFNVRLKQEQLPTQDEYEIIT